MPTSSLPPHEIVIIRRRGHGDEDGHHGGVWKIAFADFMTAMMAFFLVLWIVNSSSKETRAAVARYFNPVKLADTTPARKGLKESRELDFDASDIDPADRKEKDSVETGDAPATDVESDADCLAKLPEPAKLDAGGHAGHDQKNAHDVGHGAKTDKPKADKQKGKSDPHGCKNSIGAPEKATTGKLPVHAESALFQHPQAILSEIAASEAKAPGERSAAAPDQTGKAGLDAEEPFTDPFAPIAPTLAAKPGSTPSITARRQKSEEKLAQQTESLNRAIVAEVAKEPDAAARRMTFKPYPFEKPDEASKTDEAAMTPDAQVEQRGIQRELLSALKEEISGKGGPGFDIVSVKDGTLVSLTDGVDFEMFAIGSAEPHPRAIRIMEKIAGVLKGHPGAIVVRGHTDSRAYAGTRYDNWHLSADRAQMSYHMLVRGGLDAARLDRIEGHADRQLKNARNPVAAVNRRIEILIRAKP